jgi:hypothetical protein
MFAKHCAVTSRGTFFRPPPFFFIGAQEGVGEKGSLEVFAMTDKSRGNENGGGDYQ